MVNLVQSLFKVPYINKFFFDTTASFIPEPKSSRSFEWLNNFVLPWMVWVHNESVINFTVHHSSSVTFPPLVLVFFLFFCNKNNHHLKPSRYVLLSSFYLSFYLLFSHNLIRFTLYNNHTIYSKEKSLCHRLWKTCALQLSYCECMLCCTIHVFIPTILESKI